MSKKIINSFIVLLFICILCLTVNPAYAQTETENATGTPDIDINITDNNIKPGQTTNVTFEVHNKGYEDSSIPSNVDSELSKAENVSLNIKSSTDEVVVEDTNIDFGDIQEDERIQKNVSVVVSSELDSNFYFDINSTFENTIEVEYDTSSGNIINTRQVIETGNRYLNMVIDSIPRIEIVDNTSDIAVNETGVVNIDIKNRGELKGENITAFFNSKNTDVNVLTDSVNVRDLESEDSKDIEIKVKILDSADEGNEYTIKSNISFTDSEGIEYNSKENISVIPESERVIDVDIDESANPIGDNGETTINIENKNDIDLKNSKLIITSPQSELQINNQEKWSRYVGDIETNDDLNIDIPTQFTDGAIKDVDYKLDVVLNYSKDNVTNSIYSNISLTPDEERDISLDITDGILPVGGYGSMELELENKNDIDMNSISVNLRSKNSDLSISGQNRLESRYRLDNLQNEESTTFTVLGILSSNAIEDAKYPVEATISYEDNNEIKNTITKEIEFIADEEQKVSTSIDEGDLSEGMDDSIDIKTTNEGPKDVQDININIQTRNDLIVKTTKYNIENIKSGETDTSSIPVEVPLNTNTLNQEIDIVVDYTYDDIPHSVSSSSIEKFKLEELSKEFDISVINNSEVARGGESVIQINVTNNRDERISNVDAEFSANSPLSISDSSSYISSLDSGESAVVNVTTSVSSDATVNSYPLDLDFQYDDKNGNTRLSEVYSVQVNVIESDSGLPLGIIGVGLVIVIGSVYYNRNRLQKYIS